MSNQREGIVFLLPQSNKNTRHNLRDYAYHMNNALNTRIYDFSKLIENSIDKLHNDGYGVYSPRLNYTFSVRYVQDIKDFINKLNATYNSAVIRFLVTDMQNQETDSIKVPNVSHLAIMVFVNSDGTDFIAPASHPNPPLFYQQVRSVTEAVILTYAVSIDSIMCHAVGLCDDRFTFDAKKELLKEKVAFLCSNYLKNDVSNWFNPEIVREINNIKNSIIKEETPYISLLSPFIGLIKNHVNSTEIACMYARLWEHFVIWYVQEHKRYIKLGSDDSKHIYLSLQTVKNCNGQINFRTLALKINEVLIKNKVSNGKIQQVFLVILRHMPTKNDQRIEMETLFEETQGSLHQGSWNIATSESIKKYVGDDNIVVHNMFITTIEEDKNEQND